MSVDNSWTLVKKSVDKPRNYNIRFKNKRINPIKCGCIIFNMDLDQIVLVQNNYLYESGIEKWGLPKGHVEKNETYGICASREVGEETGLNVNLLDSMYKIKINNTYYFPIKIDKCLTEKYLIPKDISEIKCAKWFSLDNIDVLLNREARIFFKSKLNQVLFKLKLFSNTFVRSYSNKCYYKNKLVNI